MAGNSPFQLTRFAAPVIVFALVSIHAALPATSIAAESLVDPEVRARQIRNLESNSIPPWASECVLDLLETREHNAHAPTVAPENELCVLDSDVDLLAAAALALEDPKAVLAIYEKWYPNEPSDLMRIAYRRHCLKRACSADAGLASVRSSP